MNLIRYLIFFFSLHASAATIIYSNDGMGDLEPCGCRSNPQGGLVRKARLIETLKDPSFLQLDAGNFMFPTLEIPEGLQEQYELQAGYLVKALDVSKQDVIVPGEKDFALGVKKFKDLIRKSKIHFLAANLRDKGGKLLFQSSHIFKLTRKDGKKIRIAVLGIVGKGLSFPKELKIDDPISTAKKLVPALKKESDLVVVVSNQGLEGDRELATQVKGIDHIFGGQTQSFLQVPQVVGKTSIYQSSFRNQYIGVIQLDRAPDSPEFHQLLGLDANYEAPTEITDENKKLISVKLVSLIRDFKTAIAKLNSETALKTTLAGGTIQGVRKFHTFPKCAECHMKQYDFWRKTPHADALSPLLDKKQIRNKECLACHTLGQGDPDGYSELNQLVALNEELPNQAVLEIEDLQQFLKNNHDAKKLTDKIKIEKISGDPWLVRQSISKFKYSFAPVQCENCHQPGANHPFSESYTKAVAETRCLKCHTPERAPAWYKDGKLDTALVANKRKLITCPSGELQEEGE